MTTFMITNARPFCPPYTTAYRDQLLIPGMVWYGMVHTILMSLKCKLLYTRQAKIYNSFRYAYLEKIFSFKIQLLYNETGCGFNIKTTTSLVQVPRMNDASIHLFLKCRSVPPVNLYLTVYQFVLHS